MTEKDFMLEFDARFGNKEFSIDNLSIKKISIRNIPTFRCDFNSKIQIDREIDVVIAYKMAYINRENTTVILSRYPTLGFQISFTYSDSFDYECVWFKSWSPKYQDFPGREEIQRPVKWNLCKNERLGFTWRRCVYQLDT